MLKLEISHACRLSHANVVLAVPRATLVVASGVREVNVEQLEQVAVSALRKQVLQTADQHQHHEPLSVTTTPSVECNSLYLEHQQAKNVKVCCCICNLVSRDSLVRPLQCKAVFVHAVSSGHPTATYTATQPIRQESYVYSVRGKQLANYVSSVRSVAAALYLQALHQHRMYAPLTGVTVLVDPWLEGDLIFAHQTWLYRGSKGALNDVKLDLDAIGSQADVILLSQVRGAANSQPCNAQVSAHLVLLSL